MKIERRFGDRKKNIIVFGAGKRGYKLVRRIGCDCVEFFCDNSMEKVGKKLNGIPIISFDEMEEIRDRYEVILSTDLKEMRQQLMHSDIRFWESIGINNNYLLQKNVKHELDNTLMERFLYDTELLSLTFARQIDNWYRMQYYDEDNHELVEYMRLGMQKKAADFLNTIYAENQEIYSDELYDMRPGLKLITGLICSKHRYVKNVRICDLACGHGELLLYLKGIGFSVFGVEADENRMQFCRNNGIECRLGSVEETTYPEDSFDYVICTECLEHVQNPFAVVEEIKRILKQKGLIFVTVPYGRACDCKTHIRNIDISDISTLFSDEGFKIINILRIPYIYTDIIDNNIFLCAMKMN